MTEKIHSCELCGQEFDRHVYKITHNCPEKPEDRCKKRGCAREPKDNYGYCSGHKPKIWSGLVGEKEIKEKEVPVWDVEIAYNYELRATGIKAPSRDRAVEIAEEKFEPEMMHTVFKDVNQKGTVTETEDKGWKKEPPKFRKLDSMEVETVTGEN